MAGKATHRRDPLLIGHRVVHATTKRSGFIVGRGEPNGIKSALYPVTLEGTTRTELWPEHLIRIRPKKDQFPAHGGKFKAPAGYPLYTHGQTVSTAAAPRRSRA